MSAIPTRYAGVQFRSRIEARWAVMFDLLDWRWEYEPIDLEGYIPDFILMFPAGGVLVEVKPAFTTEQLIAEAARKIDRSGWRSKNDNDALILGATCLPGGYRDEAGALRQIMETDSSSNYPGEWSEALWFTCNNCHCASIYHSFGGFFCAVCGRGEGGVEGAWGDGHMGLAPDVKTMWAEAGNAVQWRPPRQR